MNDWMAIAVSVCGVLLTIAASIKMAGRTEARVEERTEMIRSIATEAKKIGLDAHEKIELDRASNGIYREILAKEMVARSDMKEFKVEIMDAIKDIRERVDRIRDTMPKTSSNI